VNTIDEIKPANIGEIRPEFGTSDDVRKYYGIKKGTLYNLHKLRKVRGKVLRVTGQFKGVRLWDMGSIRDYIQSIDDDRHNDNDNDTQALSA
jgi:hypothetical protein